MDKFWHRQVFEMMPLPQRVQVAKVAHEFRSKVPGLNRDGSIELTIKYLDFLERRDMLPKKEETQNQIKDLVKKLEMNKGGRYELNKAELLKVLFVLKDYERVKEKDENSLS